LGVVKIEYRDKIDKVQGEIEDYQDADDEVK